MRRLSLLLFRCHGLCCSAHGLWIGAVCHAEKMQAHPLCVSDRERKDLKALCHPATELAHELMIHRNC
jgi:hypothetical protein